MDLDTQPTSDDQLISSRRQGFHFPAGTGLVFVLLVLVLVAYLNYTRFFEIQNLENLMQQNVALGLIAIGVAFVIIGGNFDLSVGPVYGLAGVIFADVAQHHSIGLALLAGLGSGVASGVITAFAVTRLRITSFLASLATGTFIGGVALAASLDGTVTVTKSDFVYLGQGKVAGIPVDLIIFVVALIMGGLVLGYTSFGQWVRAVGGNGESARLSGLPVERVRAATFVISGALAAVAGMVAASQVSIAQYNAGANLTLYAIAVVVVGGIPISGGVGQMWRVLLGFLIFATLGNMFTVLALSSVVQEISIGGVVVIALIASQLRAPGAAVRGRLTRLTRS